MLATSHLRICRCVHRTALAITVAWVMYGCIIDIYIYTYTYTCIYIYIHACGGSCGAYNHCGMSDVCMYDICTYIHTDGQIEWRSQPQRHEWLCAYNRHKICMYTYIYTHIHTYLQMGGSYGALNHSGMSGYVHIIDMKYVCIHIYIHIYIHTYRWVDPTGLSTTAAWVVMCI